MPGIGLILSCKKKNLLETPKKNLTKVHKSKKALKHRTVGSANVPVCAYIYIYVYYILYKGFDRCFFLEGGISRNSQVILQSFLALHSPTVASSFMRLQGTTKIAATLLIAMASRIREQKQRIRNLKLRLLLVSHFYHLHSFTLSSLKNATWARNKYNAAITQTV